MLVKPDGSVDAELNIHTSDISIETHSPCTIFAPTETIAREVAAADGEWNGFVPNLLIGNLQLLCLRPTFEAVLLIKYLPDAQLDFEKHCRNEWLKKWSYEHLATMDERRRIDLAQAFADLHLAALENSDEELEAAAENLARQQVERLNNCADLAEAAQRAEGARELACNYSSIAVALNHGAANICKEADKLLGVLGALN